MMMCNIDIGVICNPLLRPFAEQVMVSHFIIDQGANLVLSILHDALYSSLFYRYLIPIGVAQQEIS